MSSDRGTARDPLENEWIRRAAGGDDAAFRSLVLKYQDQVYGVALRMMRDRELATEAAQDAFIKAFRGLTKFQERSRFSTWLYRITVNVCYDRLARRPDRPGVPIEDLVEQGREPAADAGWSNEADLEWSEGAAAFERALSELPETYRLPFVLRQVEERSYEEIARILDITETNAKVRVHRAREALVEKLRQKGVL